MPVKGRLTVAIMAVSLSAASTLFAAATAITKTQDFDFGSMVGGAGYSGTVTIGTSGVRSSTGSIILRGTTFSPAQFTITGNAGKSYALTLPASYPISSGANQMTVSSFTASIPSTGTIPSGGSLPFIMGGTLTVGSTQAGGTYNGTGTVTVK